MLNTVKGWLAPPVFEDEEKNWIAKILNAIVLAGIGLLGALVAIRFIEAGGVVQSTPIIYVILLGLMLPTLVMMRRGYVRAASLMLVLIAWTILAWRAWHAGGIRDTAFIAFILIILLANLLLGWKAGLTFTGLVVLAGWGLAYAEANGIIALDIDPVYSDMLDSTVIFGLAAVILAVTTASLNTALQRVRRSEQSLSQSYRELQQLSSSLEQQVQARTAELTLSMAVGQRAAAIRNVDELLPTITEFIRAQFDLYYTHVYFVDNSGEKLVIRAGTGEVGQQLLTRRYSLPIGPGSIVGQVAATGQAIVVSDTETSDMHKPNSLLPDTRSELAVPLLVEGRVLGVLDMQSDRVNTFTEANLTVFEAMATQLAIAIDSAQQWSRSQEAQRRAEEAVRQLTREVWAERLSRQHGRVGFAYDLAAVTPLDRSNEPTAVSSGYAAPLLVQNQRIGQLAVAAPPDQPWTEDEQNLLAAVAQQLAQKAENLRLFEQTQERASRERLTRQITDKIRTSRDIETALKTAAEELSRALGTSRAVVDLRVTEDQETNGQ